MFTIPELQRQFPYEGRVEWLSYRPKQRSEVIVTETLTVTPETGIEGDHYQGKNHKRQVTLIQAEHLPVIAQLLWKESIDPALLRRNIVVAGINLLALTDRTFQLGNVTLQMTGHCHPCSRMEEMLGAGGYNAMRGHGGITCQVISGGVIHLHDEVRVIE